LASHTGQHIGGDVASERAREREAATREILQVISRSREDEGPVFDAILENACRLCDAPLAYLSMTTEDRTHVISPARRGTFAKFGTTLDNLRVPLEHILTGLNRKGFPRGSKSDSRCGLVKEASLHDETSFD
jgi:hypothetical protein